MPKKMETTFSVLKATEGGIGQKEALRILRGAGIEAKPGYSPYVGHTGVVVFGGQTRVRRAARLLYRHAA